jgi:hypothetical protein
MKNLTHRVNGYLGVGFSDLGLFWKLGLVFVSMERIV